MEIRRLPEFDRWLERLGDRIPVLHVTRRISRLEAGNAGDVKSVGGGVSELRIDHGPGDRLYFTRRGSALVLLLCGGDKSSQHQDIVRAKALARTIEGTRDE